MSQNNEEETPKSRTAKSKDKYEPLLYNGNQYVCCYSLKDGSILYKCTEKSCLARVRVDKESLSILSELSKHSGHRSPRVKANDKVKKATPSSTANTSSLTYDKADSKSVTANISDHMMLRKTLSTPENSTQSNLNKNEKQVKTSGYSRGSSCPALNETNLEEHTSPQDASHSSLRSNHENISTLPTSKSTSTDSKQSSHINIDESSSSTLAPLHSPCTCTYKIRYEELYGLKNSLIDKIVEKEKKIWEQEKSLDYMKTKIDEMSASENTGLVNEKKHDLQDELEEHKRLVSSLLTTVKTLEAALSVKESKKEPSKSKTVPLDRRAIAKANPTKTDISNSSSQTKITIVGDSHVRLLQKLLISKVSPTCNIQCVFRGGSTLGEVPDLLAERKFTASPGDILTIFAGANDVCKTSWNELKSTFEKILTKYNTCRIGVVLIPLRRGSHRLNSHISHLNQKIVSYFVSKDVKIIDPEPVLSQEDYSIDGTHLTKPGKDKICELLKQTLLDTKTDGLESCNPGEPKKYIHGRKSAANNKPKVKIDRNNRKKDLGKTFYNSKYPRRSDFTSKYQTVGRGGYGSNFYLDGSYDNFYNYNNYHPLEHGYNNTFYPQYDNNYYFDYVSDYCNQPYVNTPYRYGKNVLSRKPNSNTNSVARNHRKSKPHEKVSFF